MKHSFFDPSNAGRDGCPSFGGSATLPASRGFPRISSGGQSALRACGPTTHNPSQPLPPGRATFGVFAPPGDAEAIAHWRAWQAHVDAGRIGNNAPCPPDVEARRNAREREWRRIMGR